MAKKKAAKKIEPVAPKAVEKATKKVGPVVMTKSKPGKVEEISERKAARLVKAAARRAAAKAAQ